MSLRIATLVLLSSGCFSLRAIETPRGLPAQSAVQMWVRVDPMDPTTGVVDHSDNSVVFSGDVPHADDALVFAATTVATAPDVPLAGTLRYDVRLAPADRAVAEGEMVVFAHEHGCSVMIAPTLTGGELHARAMHAGVEVENASPLPREAFVDVTVIVADGVLSLTVGESVARAQTTVIAPASGRFVLGGDLDGKKRLAGRVALVRLSTLQ